ncbi:hypothetical protein DFH06DRAFT_1240768 [Mycena polygramma]|nr:hypothetical protein DFH06DRAFT_1240768 [Mycena polygramma]
MAAPLALPVHLVPPAAARRRISEIDFEIASLKRSIAKRRREKAVLGDHLASYIYPVLTLPNEVVSEIFQQSLKPGDYYFSDPRSPLFLGHICQRWRDIALSTPSLWTTITLDIENISKPESWLRLLDIWLTRSRQCPLYVALTDDCARPRCRAALARRFVDAIVPHHRRFRMLRLKVGYDDLPKLQSELPLLRELHIWPLHYSPPPTDASPLFLGAPRLKTLAIHGLHHAMFPFEWERLTTLFLLTRACLDNVAQILRMASNLTDFTVQLGRYSLTEMDDTIELPPIPPLVHLRNIVLLTMSTTSSTALQRQLLEILTLPALARLEVAAHIPPAVADLLSRSHCPLDALEIRIVNTEYWPFVSSGEVKLTRAKDDFTEDVDDTSSSEEDDEDSDGGGCDCCGGRQA